MSFSRVEPAGDANALRLSVDYVTHFVRWRKCQLGDVVESQLVRMSCLSLAFRHVKDW